MNKSQLIAVTAENTGLTKKDAERVLNAALDAITAAMTEYADKRLRREERPSVLKLLNKLKELVASRDPVKNKEKERSR